ncbi:AI-2E family transporter [Haliangium sp.]|uniref:AI-2E family transporter n=1 Tax=Haliangium sp. TaxID=2663208 RepID=UPI003D0F9F3D
MSTATGGPTDPPPTPPERPRRSRRSPVFSLAGWLRRTARLWGFFAFVVLVVVLARHVILPFIFALLVAYILAPLVERMSRRPDGTRRMHRAVAIIACYIVFLAALAGFVVLLLPRLSKDAARIGRELPSVYQKVNDEWAPDIAAWIHERFPGPAAVDDPDAPPHTGPSLVDPEPAAALPPHTAFVLTPLPDGRLAVELPPGGLAIDPRHDGGLELRTGEAPVQQLDVEERIRAWVSSLARGLQSRLGDLVQVGQSVVAGFVRSVFTFFLVLMVAAFILLDLEKLHRFVRNLVPDAYRVDYDVIVAGMNRGLAGVIRGQLMICLINGVLTYIGLVIFGVKYSLILAMVAATMSLIPIFGSILSTVPIVVAALVSGEEGIDVARAVASVAWIIGIHFIEANMLNPKIIGTAAKIHPVLVIFALIVGESSYGLVGALLAVPVTSMIQVLFVFFRNKAWKGERGDSGPERGEVGAEPAADPAEPASSDPD